MRVYTSKPNADRFWKYVDKSDECWEWVGALAGIGYGVLGGKEGRVYAHRLSLDDWKLGLVEWDELMKLYSKEEA